MYTNQSSKTASMIPKFIFGFLFFLICLISALGKNPNVVIILADDLGYGDCEPFNPDSRISTPNLNQLAREGIRFTDAHAASGTCTPSRYGLLTGINPARTGVLNTLLARGKVIISEDEKTTGRFISFPGISHPYGRKMAPRF